MGKKNFALDDEDLQVRTSKLPIDSTGTGKVMSGYQELPVTMLHPCTLKRGNDYSRHGEVLSERFVETVKAVGIIEALIVRPSKVKMGMYEIIAGESRWEHAKTAGFTKVPCRIMDLDDEQARMVFDITNLMRRELTVRDKINGWYSFFEEMKGKSSCTEELRQMIEEDKLGVMSVTGVGGGIKLRAVYRYVKLHDLVPEWIDRLENGTATLKAGEKVASFPSDIQKKLLLYKVPEGKLSWLLAIYRGKNKQIPWSENIIVDNLELLPSPEDEKPPKPEPIPLTKEEKAARRQQRKYNKAFKQTTAKLLDTAREKIPPEDYGRADEIVAKALELYYTQARA